MDIRNSTFIVTGGGSGLGAATVEMIVASGGNAVIADVNRAARRSPPSSASRRCFSRPT